MEQGQEVQVTGHAHLIEMHPDKDLKGRYGHLGLGDTGECSLEFPVDCERGGG